VKRLLRAPSVWLCGLFFAAALFGPWLVSRAPERIDLAHAYELPSRVHWLGTADNGVDLLSALMHGARLAGVIALSVVGISLLLGTLLGTLAGLRGGKLGAAIMGLADLLQAFPAVLLNIALLALVAHPGVGHVVLSLCMNGWVLYARLSRAEVLSLREREFIQAAQVMGVPTRRILFKELLPNLVAPIVVATSLSLPAYVTAEAGLSYLGIGITGIPSLGQTINDAQSYWEVYPLYLWAPVLTITVLVLALNLLGDSIRDAFDPRTRR
jgi:ABC-type dipeptide/oligopeptide/nickel transport system permease subunit